MKGRSATLVRDFLQALVGPDPLSPHAVAEVLAARGFLLDRDGEVATLSDNSHSDDARLLDELLPQWGGSLRDGIVHLPRAPLAEELESIFQVFGGGEAVSWAHWERWANFRNRRHGPKVPVRALDPFVARLVKAVTAIGLGTCSACDGHGENRALIHFTGPYHSAWFQIVLDEFVRPRLVLTCSWSSPSRSSTSGSGNGAYVVRHPDGDVLALYGELQTVAALLYENRSALREVKQKTVTRMNQTIAGVNEPQIAAMLHSSAAGLWPDPGG
jgi:hypothetical protein